MREAREETGWRVDVTGFIGIWLDDYEDDVIAVAYYAARAREQTGAGDPAEVLDMRWFAWDEIPTALAPPGTLRAVLDAWRAGAVSTALPDRR